MAAEVNFVEHPEYTDDQVVVRHGDPASLDRHEGLGFFDGWGAVIAALTEVAERGLPT